jgi:DNA recombination protein RmuC
MTNILPISLGFVSGAVITWFIVTNRFRASLEKERIQRTVAETRLQEMERNLSQQKALLTEAESRWKDAFENISAKALATFQQGARADLTERQTSIEGILKPLQGMLSEYQKRLQQSETSQTHTLGQVRAQIESLMNQNTMLTQETSQLRRILGSNQARGKWGEETLRRVVESAGMSTHCDFSEQIMQGDGKPDLIIHLPGDRVIIIDSKVPDLEFIADLENGDDGKRKSALESHAAKLKQTIKALADRDYPNQFPKALDHVVLFLPAESLFSLALEGDRELILWASSRKILLATPASLIGILRAVALSWQQQVATENAQKIVEAGSDLYERVVKFTEHLVKIRDHLEKANTSFNDALGSVERRVIPAAEKLKKLGASKNDLELPEIKQIETAPRLPMLP